MVGHFASPFHTFAPHGAFRLGNSAAVKNYSQKTTTANRVIFAADGLGPLPPTGYRGGDPKGVLCLAPTDGVVSMSASLPVLTRAGAFATGLQKARYEARS